MKRKSTITGHFALTGVAAALLGLCSPGASALGLGKLSVQSSLGETMRAEIEVTSLTPEESANLKIRVAPPESYRAANVDYNPVLPSTQAVLQRRADGRVFVRLTSDRGVQEPFIDVILEISWATGRLVREYTLLFDPPSPVRMAAQPPTEAAGTSSPVAAGPVSPIETSPMARGAAPMTARERRAAARQAAADARAAAASNAAAQKAATAPAGPGPSGTGADEYKVQSGDTLSKVASRTQRAGVSLDQMLVSLFRANPSAFSGDNMNRLKAGVVLSVPSADAAAAVPTSEARQVITAQSADFGAYRQKLAGSTIVAPKVDADTRTSSGKVQAQIEDRKPATSPTPDRLTLSKGTAAAEAQASRDREQRDSSTRVNELNRNLQDLKNLPPAKASPPAPPVVAPPPPLPSATRPAPPPATPALTVPSTGTVPTVMPTPPAASTTTTVVVAPPASAPMLAASTVVVAPVVAPVIAPVASAPVASAPVVVPPVVVAKPPPPKPKAADVSWFDSMMADNPIPLAGGGLLVALLAAFGIYKFAKRSRKESGETSFLESRLQPDSFFGASGGQRIDTRDGAGNSSSMTYSLSQLDAIGDVDPVAEADVYLAYGRDLQAEEILKEAMRSNPERMAIRTKLLEVYAKRRDTKGFEMLATQLFGLTRGEGEDWAKAQELGLQIDPDNPLFQPGGTPDRAPDSALPSDALGASTLPQSVTPEQSRFATSVTDSQATDSMMSDLDLDLDNPDVGTPSRPMALDETISLPPRTTQPASFQSSTLKMPLSATELTRDTGPDSRNPPTFDLSSISLDLDKPESAPMPLSSDSHSIDFPAVGDDGDEDPLARKLELAEEFERIGDKDGARDLLREVLATATGVTKTKAQRMLDSLH